MEKISVIPVQYLKGIGPKRVKVFSRVGINTIEDLLYYFPRRYEDRRNFTTIAMVKEGQTQTLKATVLAKGERNSWRRRGFSILEVVVGDETGKIFCVWFNQSYLRQYFRVGTNLILYGKVEKYGNRLQMNSPEFEIIYEKDSFLDIGRIVPIYTLPDGITQRNFRHLVKVALDEYLPMITDCLPYDIRSRNNLYNLAQALLNIHFPEDAEAQKEAYRRLSFEEFFLFQVPLILRKLKKRQCPGIAHRIEGRLADSFITALPFQLTTAQQKAVEEIKHDMAKPVPMHRLLQGDVGSGKTVVATIASLISIQGGYQVAFMVPTEILAKQHYEKIMSQCQNTTISGIKEIKIGLLTSGLDKKEKEKILSRIAEGKVNLVIGTHALLEGSVQFKRLGLVVIDEQHKFGVGQRALLPQKGLNPDVLIMTATPIPRTLAITLYGDLDITVINELPAGRLAIKTFYFDEKETQKAYELAIEQLRLGRQVYIVYPVIEESYAMDITGAKKRFAELKSGVFKDFRVGLIHGRLKQAEQDKTMEQFKEGKLDVLIATTILEVGIDIANATCMIIEYAERFGLAQLHQLRGRIGRGKDESFCILVSRSQTEEAKARLEAMVKYTDGFRIAEEDLKIRGPGEFFGRRQHGLCELKIANPLTQLHLLKRSREEAIRLLARDSGLIERTGILLKEKILEKFPEYEKLILVG
ncbi:MAG: ATP-dependent DNA helicase RecG [Candidatus Omnitrophica bacterium]|nr:ATP-dependent DNA helicase RecG [Candidatus Omnitrophota bacterium]